MGGRAFITGKAMVCSLGDSLKAIVDAVRQRRIRMEQLPFTLAGLPYTRPYYLIMRSEADRLENRSEAHFYEILFSTVARALTDSGVTGDKMREMPIFFGSTSMDVPVFEGNHRIAPGSKHDKGCHAGLDPASSPILDSRPPFSRGQVYPRESGDGNDGIGIYDCRNNNTPSTVSEMFLRSSNGYGKIAGAVGERFGMEAACYSFTTACTSSANALLYAAAMIRERHIERALVVGYDLFNNLGFYGFEGLKSLAASDYRPFDRARDGLILGEACGAVVLEGKRRKADDFECIGGANLCDIYSVTSHDEEGVAVAETMQRALAQAGVDPGDICAVKAHASGTENNDRAECAAMKAVFDRHLPPVTCLKPFIGHTAGACGVGEAILFTESVKTGFIPSTPGFRDMDEELNLRPLTENRATGEGVFMLNTFGFGGNCTTLLLSNRKHAG